MTIRRRALLLVAPLALAAAACGSTELASSSVPETASRTDTPAAVPAVYAQGDLELIPSLVERLQPSIVSVLVQSGGGGGQGSGVVWDGEQGLVVTNNHVVEGASSVQVQLANGEQLPAQVRATDPETDLAVISVDRTDLPSAEFADELPRVGELAIAIGNPLGFENTVTAGIVSALHRDLGEESAFVDLIQTDAPISPGNSGGALVNGDGQVIGINSAGIPPANSANSLGFAIPSTTVRTIVGQLVANGQARHAFLGVTSEPAQGGVRITSVGDGTAAAAAGLAEGDLVTAIDGEPVESTGELVSELRSRVPGDTVTLTVQRGGETVELQATLGDRDEAA
jgi:S1-C subfamily serine protease